MAHLNIPQDKAKEILETLEDELSPHDWRLIREIFDDSIRRGIVTIVQNDRDIPPES
jgi:predicted unusual protein kinase regulating ubiquinone biosynthesis (AarF/ABC1/UbiB family)